MRFVPRSLSRRYVRLAIASLVGLALAGPAAADEDCESALVVAEKSYQLGLFEDVPAQLAPCTQGEASRAESVNATALLAKTYIAMDDMEKARDAVADLLRLEPSFETATPPRLAALLREVRSSELEVQVASVSKTSESLREAPATVVVIGADEIERRGYLDLEQLLHDLPGFDVSRGNGETYSTFYQRGFRSNDNDRLLLLLDGVEQNDIATGVAHVSRQFPIGAVERVEVVYGPASTIYGANAFSGVINIITKQPQAYLAPGKRLGALAVASGGAFGSRGTDLTLAGRDKSGSVSWSITGRLFRSDEPDLSELPGWQYDFSSVPYEEILRFTGSGIDEFCASVGCDSEGALLRTIRDSNGVARSITVTEAGAALARRMDEGLGLRFSDSTEDWSLNARLQLANLTVGLEAWNLEEGTAPWYNGDAFARHAPGTWAPEHRSFFVKYGRSLGKSLSLNLFTRYRQSTLDPQRSARREIVNYANGRFSIVSLVLGCFTSFETGVQVPCRPIAAEAEDSRLLATQTAAEVTLVYGPSRRFTLVSGLDLKKAAVQTRQQLLVTNELGTFPIGSGDQVVDHTDLGAFAQASFKPRSNLSLVAGGRLDYNEASSPDFADAGFGTLFSPRLAVVYLPGDYAFKAIYSEAFKDPSDFEKLGATGRRIANPELRQERSRSVELSAGWHPDGRGSLELAAYRTRYEDVVGLGQACVVVAPSLRHVEAVPCPPNPNANLIYQQFQNLVGMEVRGVELRGTTKLGKVELFGNLTYVDPQATRPTVAVGNSGSRNDVRIADIASHRANFGLELPVWKQTDLHLRWNYVGARRTGEGTTVATNPLREVDAYSTVHAALTGRDFLPGATLQLVVDNLLDTDYEHPGVFTADGEDFASSLPQPGRAVYARIAWRFGGPREPSATDR